MSSFQALKQKTLEQRIASLTEEYEAVGKQLNREGNAADRLRLQRQMSDLEEEIKQVIAELDKLKGVITNDQQEDENVVTPPVRGRSDPPSPPRDPPGPIKNRWALLVGINRYNDPAIPPLNFCVNDVLALEKMLTSVGYTVVTLHDDAPEAHRKPTRTNVEAELKTLCDTATADDLLLVHLGCHGELDDKQQPVLVLTDTRRSILAESGIPLVKVETQLRASKARRLVIFLDACHAGVKDGSRGLPDPQFLHNAHDLAEGFALIAASTAQQKAQEWQKEKHGVFTYFLLEGLAGRADHVGKQFVTVDDVKTYVLDGLRRWRVENSGLIQEPTARSEGMGDIILADRRPGLGQANLANAPNPFHSAGCITDPAHFFDREELLRQLFEALAKGENRSLVGQSQVGKSSILRRICQLGPERLNLPPEAFIYFDMQIIQNEDEFFEALSDKLAIPTARGYKLARSLADKRYVLCIDEIEKMNQRGHFTGDERTELRGLADGVEQPFKLVIASRLPLEVLFPDSAGMTSPLANICPQIDVPLFQPEVAKALLRYRLANTGVDFTTKEMDELVAQSNGHPAQLQQAAAKLFERYRRGGA